MGRPPHKDSVLLSEVRSLTLHGHGAVTTHRRVPAAPQLKCVSSPNLCAIAGDPDVMRCTNAGAAYSQEDVQWECTASFPDTVKLTSTDVVCEGYRSSTDDYVLRGSCGVEYRLALTSKGHAQYPNLSRPSSSSGDDSTSLPALLFLVIFLAVLFWIVTTAYQQWTRNQNNPQLRNARHPRRPNTGGWNPGWGGGGDDNDGNDPPPPYPGGGAPKFGASSPSRQGREQQGWRPGFWTGATGGAAAGYAAGRYQSSRENTRAERARDNGYYEMPPAPSSVPRRTSSPGQSTPSTGFGGTSRR